MHQIGLFCPFLVTCIYNNTWEVRILQHIIYVLCFSSVNLQKCMVSVLFHSLPAAQFILVNILVFKHPLKILF